MSNPLRTTLRRKVAALLVTPLLLGAGTAAAPASAADSVVAAAARGQLVYEQTFYADASYSQVVGVGYGDCDENLYMDWGDQTPYSITWYFFPCANAGRFRISEKER